MTCTCGHDKKYHRKEVDSHKRVSLPCVHFDQNFTQCKCKNYKPTSAIAQQGDEMSKKNGTKAKEPKGPRLAGVFDEATSIFGRSKGKEIEARVYASGVIVIGEKEFNSPSAAANAATKQSRDGWLFWHVKKNGDMISLAQLTGRKIKMPKPKAEAKPKKAHKPRVRKAKVEEPKAAEAVA
jgi:Restriction Enzyme Adenine Methylase Associated